MTNTLAPLTVPAQLIGNVLSIVDDFSAAPMKDENANMMAVAENLLIRTYLHSPNMRYSDCVKAIQSAGSCQVELPNIRRIAESAGLENPEVRAQLAEWAYKTVGLIYEGMAGNREAFEKAMTRASSPYSDTQSARHLVQNRYLLFAMFEFIPELRASRAHETMKNLGRKFCKICLRKVLDSISFDICTPETDEVELSNEDLLREVYLAKRELEEYRELVEAGDADFENKLEELKQQELAEFFRSLNDQKYGHIIDSVYLQSRACTELRRKGEKLPYLLEGVPSLFERILLFFRDAGIAPACKFPPNSVQRLTLLQMEGCQFEPHPSRTAPLTEDSEVTVRVVSSGWRYGDIVISCPILREEKAAR